MSYVSDSCCVILRVELYQQKSLLIKYPLERMSSTAAMNLIYSQYIQHYNIAQIRTHFQYKI